MPCVGSGLKAHVIGVPEYMNVRDHITNPWTDELMNNAQELHTYIDIYSNYSAMFVAKRYYFKCTYYVNYDTQFLLGDRAGPTGGPDRIENRVVSIPGTRHTSSRVHNWASSVQSARLLWNWMWWVDFGSNLKKKNIYIYLEKNNDRR